MMEELIRFFKCLWYLIVTGVMIIMTVFSGLTLMLRGVDIFNGMLIALFMVCGACAAVETMIAAYR
jgi:hypothetical protein